MMTNTQRANILASVREFTDPVSPVTPTAEDFANALRYVTTYDAGYMAHTLRAAEFGPQPDRVRLLAGAVCSFWPAKDRARLVLRAFAHCAANPPANGGIPARHCTTTAVARQAFTELCKFVALRRRPNPPRECSTHLLRLLHRATMVFGTAPLPGHSGEKHTVQWEAAEALQRYRRTYGAIRGFWMAEWIDGVSQIPLPWADEPWYARSETALMMLAHRSSTNPGQVAYLREYSKLTHGDEPVFTVTSPGKFLSMLRTRLMAEEQAGILAGIVPQQSITEVLTDEVIKGYVNTMVAQAGAAKYELRVLDNDDPRWVGRAAELRDEWKRLYAEVLVDGSCMRGSEGVRAYGLPGNHLGLAYLYHPASKTEFCRAILHRHGKFPAGTLQSDAEYIDPLTKDWTVHRAFGCTGGVKMLPKVSEEQMTALLREKGWHRDCDLHGALLASLDTDGYADDDCDEVLMPYIDGAAQWVNAQFVDGQRVFVVHDGGDYLATDTSGWIALQRTLCPCCGEPCDEEYMTYVENEGESVCETCIERHYVPVQFRYSTEWVHRDRLSDVAVYDNSDDRWVGEGCAEWFDLAECAVSGEWYNTADMCDTAEGYVHEDDAVRLSLPDDEGNEYGHPDYVVRTTRIGPDGCLEEVVYVDGTDQREVDAFLSEYDEYYVRKETWGQYVSYFTRDDEVQVTLPEDPTIYW